MKNLISIILIISFCLTLACTYQIDKEKNEFKQKLEKLLTQDKTDNKYLYKLLNLYGTVLSLSADKSEMSKFNVCQKLKSIDSSKLEDEEILYYYATMSFGGCKIAENDKVLEKVIISGRQSENLDEFFRSFILGYQNKQFQSDKVLADNCDKLLDFVDQSGAARLIKKRSTDLSYEESFKIYKMGNICFQNIAELSENEKFKSTFTKAISSFVLNSAQINEQERGMFEGCALKTTANNVQFIKLLNKYIKNSDFNKVFPQYLNFITNAYSDSECSIGRGAALRLFKSQEAYPLFSFKTKEIQLTESSEKFMLKAKLTNVFGEVMKNVGMKQKISLLLGSETIIENVSVKKTEDSDYNIQLEFDTNQITQTGYYTLQISVKFANSTDSYQSNEVIKVTTKASVDQIKFDTTNTKTLPSILKNKVQFSQVFSEKQTANQNSFMHIQFKINTPKSKQIDIKQVAVRLVNKQYSFATNLVNAVLDKNSQNYKATIDFGDPDHVLPYNDEYECELIIADQFLIENIKWKFVKLDVTFRKPAQKKPKQDTDYETEKVITHIFPSPVPNPPSIVTLGFCGIMVFAIFVFVGILLKLDLNFNKLFKNFLHNIGFFGLILAYIGVIVLFWVKINLFQTLLLFVILLPFTLIIGNASLMALKDEKLKQD